MTRAEDPVRLVIKLKGRVIPRHPLTERPEFKTLDGIKAVFEEWEVVELVNRAIYYRDKQELTHWKVEERNKELIEPVKVMFGKMFPTEKWSDHSEENEKRIKQVFDTVYPPEKKG
jgi:hypothetical protein